MPAEGALQVSPVSPQSRWEMTYTSYLVSFIGAVLVGSPASIAWGQTAPVPPAEIQPATYTSPTAPLPGALPTGIPLAEVTFAQQPAQVGDRVAQMVRVELHIETHILQAGQQAHDSQTSLRRRQQRFIEVLEVAQGSVRRAHVTYPLSRLTTTEHSKANDNIEPEVAQPVEKKSYFVTREGERLLVTDAEGAIPPQQEYAIVATNLQNLGLPNPLIQFLLGRTVRVGERLVLPPKVAEKVLGFGDQFSQVKQFELQLQAVLEIESQPCAVFAATVSAVGEPASPIRIRAFGQVVIQTQTCRTVRAEFSGPLTLATAEHTPAGNFQYAARGNMHIAVEAKYGLARSH